MGGPGGEEKIPRAVVLVSGLFLLYCMLSDIPLRSVVLGLFASCWPCLTTTQLRAQFQTLLQLTLLMCNAVLPSPFLPLPLPLSRSSDTLLGPSGHPGELFLVDECDDNPLGSIMRKVSVSPCQSQHCVWNSSHVTESCPHGTIKHHFSSDSSP